MSNLLVVISTFLLLVCVPVFSQQPRGIAAPNAPVAKLFLSIAPDQVVGHPFQGSATILLLDSANLLVTDYDLAANPIVLFSSSGLLIHDTLSDTTLLDSGVIDFLPAGCRYLGSTGFVSITAMNGTLSSVPVIVSFSGYDILAVTDFKGDSIVEVYEGLPTTVKVSVCNRGGLAVISNPVVRSYFKAGGGSVQVSFAGHKDGIVDTITVVDTALAASAEDTLIVELEARYRIDTTDYITSDTVQLPVIIRTPATVAFVDGSITPDSVYTNEIFSLGFSVQTSGFAGSVDSVRATLELALDTVNPPIAGIFTGTPVHETFVDSVLSYSALSAKVIPFQIFAPGWYPVRANYHLFSGASEFVVGNAHPDSLYIIPRSGPEYVAGSFDPDTIAAGAEASFRFELSFADGANLEVDPNTATFTIVGTGFAATVNLMVPGNMIQSGNNLITTENVFIPANQLGNFLSVSAELRYRRLGAPTYLTFGTAFDSQTVLVRQFPQIQIVSLECIAPNGNKVNTRQPFQMHARIANLSESPARQLTFRLTSDGETIDSVRQTVNQIMPLDTYDLYFDLIAPVNANPAEIFSVNFVSGDAGRLPPVDNIALVAVQTPATLVLSHTVVGAPNGYVTQGGPFSLVVAMTNLGLAEITSGEYRLSTGGVDLGLSPEDTLGEITLANTRNVTFHAPLFDSTFTITFTVTTKPIDLNIASPAVFQDSSFEFIITVASTEARLEITGESLVDRPLTVGVRAPLFALNLTNSSGSPANLMRLDSVVLRFADHDGRPMPVNRAIDTLQCRIFEGSNTIDITERHADDSLIVRFIDETLAPHEGRQFRYEAAAIVGSDGSISLILDSAGIFASFSTGPSEGLPVVIDPQVAGAPIVDIVCATGGRTLSSSFMAENNPWHQERSSSLQARFAYVLEQNAPLEFRIFTLTGELVHTKIYSENSDEGLAGSHVIEWDGKNDRGKVVFDGVYVVQLTNTRTGEYTRLKLAVLK